MSFSHLAQRHGCAYASLATVAVNISVQVPPEDRSALDDLLARLGLSADAEITEVHPFDGETVVQSVVALTAVGTPALRAWLRARVDERKAFRVVYDGVEYTGYTSEEVEALVTALSADADGEQ
jgi:hypothetical protein